MGGTRKLVAVVLTAVLLASCTGGASEEAEPEEFTTIEGAPASVVVEQGDFMWGLGRGTGELIKIDPDTNEVIETFVVGDGQDSRPRNDVWDLDATEDFLWVTSPGANVLLKIDPLTGEVVDEIDLGAFVSDLRVAAGSLWFHGKDGELIRLDPDSGTETASFKFGDNNVFVGDIAEFDGQVWVTRDTSRFVAGGGGLATFVVESELLRIDPESNRIAGRASLGSTFARGPVNPVVGELEASEDGLWMSRTYENRLLLLEPLSGEILLQFPIAAFETVWEFAVVDGDLWAGDLNESQMIWIDPESRERQLFDLGTETSFVGGGFGSAWVPVAGPGRGKGSVLRLDPAQ